VYSPPQVKFLSIYSQMSTDLVDKSLQSHLDEARSSHNSKVL